MVVLEMADHGLDGGAATHFAADGFGDPADLAADPDPEPVGIAVTAIALVAMDAAHRGTCELFKIGDDGTERMAVIRVAMQRLGVQHELPAFGCGDRGDDRDLAAELVGCPGLAFADTLHLGGVQRIDLGAALALLLMTNPQRQIEQRAKAVLEELLRPAVIHRGGNAFAAAKLQGVLLAAQSLQHYADRSSLQPSTADASDAECPSALVLPALYPARISVSSSLLAATMNQKSSLREDPQLVSLVLTGNTSPEKDFCNNICQQPPRESAQRGSLFSRGNVPMIRDRTQKLLGRECHLRSLSSRKPIFARVRSDPAWETCNRPIPTPWFQPLG